jgi:hypothetical protein
VASVSRLYITPNQKNGLGILFIFEYLLTFFYVSRNNYATFQEIKTKTITVQASNNRGDSKKAKLFITLKRSPEFFENMKRFNEIREENEKKANTLAEERKSATTEQ